MVFEFDQRHICPRYPRGAFGQLDMFGFLVWEKTNLQCIGVIPSFLTCISYRDVFNGVWVNLGCSASVDSDNDCAGNGNCNTGTAALVVERAVSPMARWRRCCWGTGSWKGLGMSLIIFGLTARMTSKYHCFSDSGGSPCTWTIWSQKNRQRWCHGQVLCRRRRSGLCFWNVRTW